MRHPDPSPSALPDVPHLSAIGVPDDQYRNPNNNTQRPSSWVINYPSPASCLPGNAVAQMECALSVCRVSSACCLTMLLLLLLARDFPLKFTGIGCLDTTVSTCVENWKIFGYQVEQMPYMCHRELPWQRLSPGITQASKELEAQQRVVERSRTGGDVNGACTLYKHPASARLSHTGCLETTAEAANNKPTGSALRQHWRQHTLFLYLIEAQLLENLVKMSTATTSEISGRIPELKTTTSVSSSTSTTPTGPRTSSLLVSQHPLLCSLLSSPSPQQLVVTPRRQQSQEVGVGGGWRNPEWNPKYRYFMYLTVGALWHYTMGPSFNKAVELLHSTIFYIVSLDDQIAIVWWNSCLVMATHPRQRKFLI